MGLVEREADLERLAGLARPHGQVALIEGPPGAGKTALMAAACARAGVRVLRARCAEDDPPHAAVRELFAGVDAHALTGAAALAAPALGLGGAEVDAFAAAHGLYWLLADLAERAPLIVAIDDAPWLDVASAAFVAHLLPRLDDLPVAVVMTARSADLRPDSRLAGALAARPDAIRVLPAPLSPDGTAALVGPVLAADVQRATAGNPLLVRSVLAAIEAGEDPAAVLGEAVSVGRVVMPRVHALGPAAVAFAEALVVLGDGAAARDVLALGGDAAARDALVAAEIVDEANRFHHPLIRAAVADSISPGRRNELQRAGADQLAAVGAPALDVARLVMRTEPAADPVAVARLRAGADEAAAAGAPEAVVELLERALAEPPAADERAELLARAANAGYEIGHPRTAEFAGSAVVAERDPVRQALTAVEMGNILFLQGSVVDSLEPAFALVERAAAVNPEAGLVARAHVTMGFWCTAEGHDRLGPRLAAMLAEADDGSPGGRLAAVIAACERSMSGSAREAIAYCDLALAHERRPGEVPADQWRYWFPCFVLANCGATARAQDLISAAVSAARSRGSRSSLRTALDHSSYSHLHLGRVAAAEADAQEADALASPFGWVTGEPAVKACVFRAALERAAPPDWGSATTGFTPSGTHFDAAYYSALGELALHHGMAQEALHAAEQARASLPSAWTHTAAFYPWQAVSVRALAALGRHEESRTQAEDLLAWARGYGVERCLVLALRAYGGREALEEAVTLDAPDATLERGWALLELGVIRRRAREVAAAREPLRAALDIAVRGGALLLARRARDELTAAGARPRRELLSGVEALTGRERRVAELAAAGASNREIAEELWLTLKTVEAHLGSVYRKLGSTRAELGARLAS